MKEYHILNGDSLKSQLKGLCDDKIVIRECLVEGNTEGDSLEAIFESRVGFFKETYGIGEKEYRQKSEMEISKILDIEPDSTINLWFENDLFCQVNLWFTVSILFKAENRCRIYLVSPLGQSWQGFGGMSYESLMNSYARKKELGVENQIVFNQLWDSFQASDWEGLRKNAKRLSAVVDQLQDVVEAHIDRFPEEMKYGRPENTLREIQGSMDNPTFGKVFQEFCRLEGIYGFGDLQVKRLMEEMK